MPRTVISRTCLVCLICFLISCSASSAVSSETPPKESISTEINSNDLKNIILGTPAPKESKVGGISGCFSALTSRPPGAINYFLFYNVFRLYSDGSVIGAKVGIGTDSIYESWDNIKTWLNRSTDDLPQGIYHTIDGHIWFDMSDTGHMLAEYYYGVIYDKGMLLSSYTQRDGSEEEKDVEYLELDCASE